MKTDREFIDGIYKKAETLRQQEDNNKSKSWASKFLRYNRENKRIPAFAASLASFAVFALVIFAGWQAGKSPNINNTGNQQMRTIDGENPNGIANVSAYGIEDGDVSMEDTVTVLGEITDVVDTENLKSINLQVTRLLCGEGTPNNITITEGLPLSLTTKISKGINVIVSVKPILGQEDYALIDENSIYFYMKDENSQIFYEAIDGTVVTEDSFE